jgi:hypothetical protein
MREYKFRVKLAQIFSIYDVRPDKTFLYRPVDDSESGRMHEIGVILRRRKSEGSNQERYTLMRMNYDDMMSYLTNFAHCLKTVEVVLSAKKFNEMENSLNNPQVSDRNFALMNIKSDDAFTRWYSKRILSKV